MLEKQQPDAKRYRTGSLRGGSQKVIRPTGAIGVLRPSREVAEVGQSGHDRFAGRSYPAERARFRRQGCRYSARAARTQETRSTEPRRVSAGSVEVTSATGGIVLSGRSVRSSAFSRAAPQGGETGGSGFAGSWDTRGFGMPACRSREWSSSAD